MKGWIKEQDGLYRWRKVYPGAALTEAEWQRLPAIAKAIPPERGVGREAWFASHGVEIRAAVYGGAFADVYAMRLITSGKARAADAITKAKAIAPASKPASFPKLVTALQQAGRTAEAAFLSMTPEQQARAAQARSTPSQVSAGLEISPMTAAAGLALLLLL